MNTTRNYEVIIVCVVAVPSIKLFTSKMRRKKRELKHNVQQKIENIRCIQAVNMTLKLSGD